MTEEDKKNFAVIYQRATSKGLLSPVLLNDTKVSFQERPHGEYVDISKLRLMTVEECAGHTIDYAMGWKACIEWIKKGGAENDQ